ncbi:NAD(P)-dependent dehydrogenase (short-subunit alcohol dehydrogenase family) [Amycolatopsis lexingtonensis]|uniref:NAD(P)-dependent dehydrogenase (Short-subunit alcohol dehydrogenase family) n=1 Tax=Amycolatopsis lexingtonensis TaxID=218822 RepID=A0ABR9I571_9PSEU|nr:SDR family oxidoreductase [Amycolatopsis lexingtonensis]MBE1498310.1 NAD(P)-dependent dehydrogenase (short-subunit alcohol dehydrogenase family) [Amycolatopsis lexingtonensis]
MDIKGAVVLVTGANRGLGRKFTEALLERGAAKVYAAARNPESVDLPGVVPLRLDVTDPASIREAAAIAGDVTLLVNNAGSSTGSTLLGGKLEDIRLEMDTHYFGTLAVTREFAPILERNGGGAVLNVLSVLSWFTAPQVAAYSAAKSAAWSLTNALRLELAPQKTQVTALHVGYMDTDMAKHVDGPKVDPALVAGLALDGVEAGRFEVLADDVTRNVRAGLSGELPGLYPALVS